jgi:hypothetical protein
MKGTNMYTQFFNDYVSAKATGGFHLIEVDNGIIKTSVMVDTKEEVEVIKLLSPYTVEVIK